jgi:hypothetical protein
MVSDTGNSGLSGDTLRTPREVTGLDTQGSELLVTTTGSHSVDTLSTNLGVSTLTTQLEFSFLSELSALGTSSGTLMTRISGNTHV